MIVSVVFKGMETATSGCCEKAEQSAHCHPSDHLRIKYLYIYIYIERERERENLLLFAAAF